MAALPNAFPPKMMENRKAIAQLKIRVQWGDMDALQHVNNTVYLRWVESTRLLFFDQLIDGTVGKAAIGPILAWQDIKYIAPVVYPDTVMYFLTSPHWKRIEFKERLNYLAWNETWWRCQKIP